MPDLNTFICLLAFVFVIAVYGPALLNGLLEAVVYAVVILVFIILIPIRVMMASLGGDNERARR